MSKGKAGIISRSGPCRASEMHAMRAHDKDANAKLFQLVLVLGYRCLDR